MPKENYYEYHVGRWKEGQYPTVNKVLAVVIYDQKYDAYIIDFEDKYDFQEWVCGEWEDYDYVKFTNLGDIA